MKGAFKNRSEAGSLLAQRLKTESFDKDNTLVIALPRGGVVVGDQIAKQLQIPLDVFVKENMGHPLHPEFNLSGADQSMHDRLVLLRKAYPAPSLSDKTIILVDEGLMTGITVMVAAEMLKAQGAANVILATPVCAKRTARTLRANFNQVVCGIEPTKFVSVAHFYKDFAAVSENEVIELLKNSYDRVINQNKNAPAPESAPPLAL